jgi:hypothetical protein
VNPNNYIPMRFHRRVAAFTALAALAITALALIKFDSTALGVLPALALPLMLALRRYPGERMLAVVSRTRTRPRPRPGRSAPLLAPSPLVVPRGGLLLACSLAVRPPPGAALAAS